jgi:hypothetical protein
MFESLEILVASKGFWRWCTTLRITGLLDIVRRSKGRKYTTFLQLDLFPFSGERKTHNLLDPLERGNLKSLKLNYDRQSVGQSVLVPGTQLGPATNFFSPLEIFFRQFRVCYFVAPSLTRGWVYNLLLLLVLASAIPLGSESRGTQDHFYCPNSWDSTSLEGQVSVFISPRNRVAHIYLRALGSLSVASYDS